MFQKEPWIQKRKQYQKRRQQLLFWGRIGLLVLFLLGGFFFLFHLKKGTQRPSAKQKVLTNQRNTQDTKSPSSTKKLKENKADEEGIHPWNQPSQPTYPSIQNLSQLSVKVSISEQRVYIQEGHQTIYTMVCSTGDSKVGNDTPKGRFQIQAERAPELYFPEDEDYVYNWVSFHNHGEYLFHSVIMLDSATPDLEEAKKLGKEASHGCIRLPLPDSKWFYDNIPTGTPVEIY